jgi:choline kinase
MLNLFLMVSTAVILAAGMGTRLRTVIGNKPKGLLPWDGQSLIEHSLRRLRQTGVKKVVMVVGFEAEQYARALNHSPLGLEFIVNSDFASTGSMHSLSLCAGKVTEDFFLLESDLLYEQRALEVLSQARERDIVLLSGPTRAGDEVYVYGRSETIEAVSKKKLNLPLLGELVGISKISRPLLDRMCALYQARPPDPKYDYELCLAEVSPVHPVRTRTLPDLAWIEIDGPEHLERAQQLVGPRIKKNETARDQA